MGARGGTVLSEVNSEEATVGARAYTRALQAERELKKSEARFRALTENVSEIITIVDRDGIISYVSPSAQRVLGLSLQGPVGQGIFEHVHPDDAPTVKTALEQAMTNPGASGPLEIRVRHRDGSWRIMEALARNLLDDPAIRGLVVTSRDITQQRQAERELHRAQRRVREAEERLRRDIAELLHSTVQTKLVVASHRLLECADLIDVDAPAAKAMLQTVREELDEVREHEVRQASHLLHPSIVDIGLIPAVRSLAARFEPSLSVIVSAGEELQDRDSVLHNQLPAGLRLHAYRFIEEALSNVARHANATEVKISLDVKPGGWLALTVSDDGHGFNPSTARRGLGLSSIAGRASELDGHWELTSQPGGGTTLEVRLPLEPQPGEAS
ncbi:MAG: PAS domain S-box protein [Chloroflexota bacterium]|nr:PAS domain S-box protein [Chloroflexota bacterium]